MSLKLELLELYRKSLKEGNDELTEVMDKKQAKAGQIRELWSLPPERFVVLEDSGNGVFLTTPLTSYLQLLPANAPVYQLRSRRLNLGVLPVWNRLRKELIENYSQVLGIVSTEELQRIKDYVSEKKELSYTTRSFLKLNSQRWARWSMYSLLAQADVTGHKGGQVVRLSPGVETQLSAYRTHALAAESRYFKGTRYFAVLRNNMLRLYLPVELVGRLIRVLVGEVVVFEGRLESVRLDLIGDFSGINLQEELRVVEL